MDDNLWWQDPVATWARRAALYCLLLAAACSQRRLGPPDPGQPGGPDAAAGVAAYQRGDDASALQILRPLAASGNAAAEVTLGRIYAGGRGVASNPAEALRLWRLAADQGDAEG